jgi:hypothetical protein
MRKIMLLALLCLPIMAGAETGSSFLSDQLACFVIVPPGWDIDTNQADEIVLTDRSDSANYISVKRYNIEQANLIHSENDLRDAIGGLYRKMGIAGVPANFTIIEGKAVFEIDFETYDISGIPYHKFLRGVICRKAADGQVLYLIIGAAPRKNYEAVLPQFKIVSMSLQITEVLSPDLFPSQSLFKYFLILVVIGLTLFFFKRNRRIQKSHNPLGRDSVNFWRCGSCGRVNHSETRFCHRCGAERVEIKVPRE